MVETTTIYVTKDAPTRGIQIVKATSSGDGYWTRVGFFECFSPSQAHLTLPEAIADAEKRRAKKIASLEKQIATMKALDLSTAVEG